MHGLNHTQLHNETSYRAKNPQAFLPAYSLTNAREESSELISGEAAEHPRACLDSFVLEQLDVAQLMENDTEVGGF